jgi:hypothetical protein
VKLSPRGEVIPQGWRASVRPFILLNIRECSPLGVNKGVNNPSRGQSSPLGENVTPGGQLMLLKTGLWDVYIHTYVATTIEKIYIQIQISDLLLENSFGQLNARRKQIALFIFTSALFCLTHMPTLHFLHLYLHQGDQMSLWKKSPKMKPNHFFVKIGTYVHLINDGKCSPKMWATFVLFKTLSKVNNRKCAKLRLIWPPCFPSYLPTLSCSPNLTLCKMFKTFLNTHTNYLPCCCSWKNTYTYTFLLN